MTTDLTKDGQNHGRRWERPGASFTNTQHTGTFQHKYYKNSLIYRASQSILFVTGTTFLQMIPRQGEGYPTPVYPTPPWYTLPSGIPYPLGYPTPEYASMGTPYRYPLPGFTIPPRVKTTPRRDLVPRIPYPLDRMTHACENVTFPQFRWRSVTRI